MLEPLRPTRGRVDGCPPSPGLRECIRGTGCDADARVSIDPETMEELLAGDDRSLRPMRTDATVEGIVTSITADEVGDRGRDRSAEAADQPRHHASVGRFRERFVRTVQSGRTIDAAVTRVMPDGAVARVAEGVEGPIRVSELAAQGVGDPAEVVQSGDAPRVKIVSVDTERRRLSLSARRADRA